MKKAFFSIVSCGLMTILCAGLAHGSIINVEMTGHVATIGSLSEPGFQQIGVEVGDPFSASILYDSAAVDLLPDDPARGQYENAILGFMFSSGVWSVSANNIGCCSTVNVWDRPGNDSYDWRFFPETPPSDSPAVLGTVPLLDLLFENVDSDLEPIFSDSLILPNGMENWEIKQIDLLGTSASGATRLHLRVETLQAQPVPEPATLLLFSTGLLGFWGVRRKP